MEEKVHFSLKALNGSSITNQVLWGGGYANERPCIDGHGGIKGGGEHNSRVG